MLSSPLIPDVIQEHLDQLQFLLESYDLGLRSPEQTESDFADLEEPVAAHVDALVLAGERILPLLEEGLAAEERMPPFTAAYVLLRTGDNCAANAIVEAFATAQGEQLEGLRDALCHSPITPVLPQLQEALASAPAPVALAAAHVLAFHGKFDRGAEARLEELFQDENPETRRAAWRVVAIVDSAGSRR